jgi:hypothetical protein
MKHAMIATLISSLVPVLDERLNIFGFSRPKTATERGPLTVRTHCLLIKRCTAKQIALNLSADGRATRSINDYDITPDR